MCKFWTRNTQSLLAIEKWLFSALMEEEPDRGDPGRICDSNYLNSEVAALSNTQNQGCQNTLTLWTQPWLDTNQKQFSR
jgi:hypothetical protein